MTLAHFEKTNLGVIITYTVEEAKHITDVFTLDYIHGSKEDFTEALKKRRELEENGARVKYIAPGTTKDGMPKLFITVETKKKGGTK